MSKIYVRTAFFSSTKMCPIHGLPLAGYARIGKWECPQRACPYTEPHPCEWSGKLCECEGERRSIETDDDDVRGEAIAAWFKANFPNVSEEFLDRWRKMT